MGWAEFTAAFIAFFASHSLPMRPPVRNWLTAVLGRRGFLLAYSALSLAVLAWLIVAAGRAPYVGLWDWAPWQSWTTLAIMLVVCVIAAFSLAVPNPLSFGGVNNAGFDPRAPGVVRYVRHPLLVVLGLWAFGHLIPNGDLAHVILFGSFATFAALGGRIVDRRKQRELGQDWARLVAQIRAAPLFTWPGRPVEWLVRLVAGVALYALLIWLHPIVIGVNPVPV
ncbi:NnrU family protein [Defluviimonas sp. 20V17]|uniref:Uncharacterized membrane protein n=1 Tax=Allgaiera indica TaxID=765699 RepID=A0AAN4UQ44_9RHOB|nr:NnrU family protein [Allgaiera indica]KDB04546.1 NnrU family protein [Defluviimonas sp. 20V17]GHD99704.1 hypothetical protein GCM10008024_08150 [Allgaiera indica]SDW20126.1 Uncharacterized membrane protein [Allgaiera indica]